MASGCLWQAKEDQKGDAQNPQAGLGLSFCLGKMAIKIILHPNWF